jgi:hypothetical protein
MSTGISYRVSQSVVSSDNSAPLSQSYYEVGTVSTNFSEVYAAGGSLQLLSVSWGAPGQGSGDLQAIELVANQPVTIQTNGNGTIGVQSLSITGSPTGGTFTLGFQGQITAGIAWNASAAAVQSALRALSTIGSNVTCTGGALPGTAVTCTFSGSLVAKTVPLLTFNASGLTGGSGPTVVVANALYTPQDVIVLQANIPLLWSITPGYFACPFLGAVTSMFVSNTNACTLNGRILTY